MSLNRQSTRITRNQRNADPIVASLNQAGSTQQQAAQAAQGAAAAASSSSATSNAPRTPHDHATPMASRSTSTRTPHRVTVRKTAYQVSRLQEMWALTTTPTKEQREQIAEEIGLDTRIVSTWFRDERSKLTRQRAEQQRTERAAIGPIRSTRMSSSTAGPTTASAISNATAASRRHTSVDALSDEMDEQEDTVDQQTLDRHDRASPSTQPPSNGNGLVQPSMQSPRSTRASPYHHHSHHHHAHNSDGTGTGKWAAVNKSPRYSPYPLSTSPDSRGGNGGGGIVGNGNNGNTGAGAVAAAAAAAAGRQYDPIIRTSAPIDIHRSHQYRNQPSQYQYLHQQNPIAHRPAQHRHHLSTETDADSIGYLSPGYPHRSVPAPSVSSSSETSDEDELDEDELIEQDGEDMVRFNQVGSYSPRTPAYLPSSLPSPRVMHAPSSSIPKSSNATGLTLPPISSLGVGFGGSPLFPPISTTGTTGKPPSSSSISPFRNPITLPTETGGTYTVEPLPVILGPQPNRDSTWRWKYYDKVSSMRHTLSDRLFHSDPAKVSSSSSSSITRTGPTHETPTTNPNNVNNNLGAFGVQRREESDDEDVQFSDGPSPIPSPRVRNAGLPVAHDGSSSRGVLERIGVFGGKKQFFATPAKYSDYTMQGLSVTATDAL